MSIALIVTKSHDEDFTETGEDISLDQWLNLVESDAELRIRTAPFTVTNPKTKQTISIDPLPGQSELCDNEEWVPFLGYRGGELVMTFGPALQDEKNPVRHKVADVARQLGAIITHDAGDEILRW